MEKLVKRFGEITNQERGKTYSEPLLKCAEEAREVAMLFADHIQLNYVKIIDNGQVSYHYRNNITIPCKLEDLFNEFIEEYYGRS